MSQGVRRCPLPVIDSLDHVTCKIPVQCSCDEGVSCAWTVDDRHLNHWEGVVAVLVVG